MPRNHSTLFGPDTKVWRVVVYGWIPRILDEGIAVRRQPVRIQHKIPGRENLNRTPNRPVVIVVVENRIADNG